ncbi:MAG: glycosyltransferase family 39 protein [Planctomycetaceae bacterium]|nr:glycosyltransferase family 39 protein [Planctomycetaceae bacterium]
MAVAVRLVAAIVLTTALNQIPDRHFLIEGDAEGYWILAGHISRGEDFALYEPPRYVMRMPGFSAVLAGSILVFGDSLLAARCLLAILTSLAVFPVVWMTDHVAGRRAGTISGLLVALMPTFIGFSVTILSECLFATVISWNIWALFRWVESRENWRNVLVWGAISGLLAALAVYIRPSWLLFPPLVLPLCLTWGRSLAPRCLLSGLLMQIVMVAALIPWGIRNQQVTGHFVLTTLWMGPSLYDGLHPGATGDSDMTFFETDRVLERMSEFEMNRYYKELGFQFVRENPGRAVELGLIKLKRYWSLLPNASQFQQPLIKLAVGGTNLVLLLFAAWGIWEKRVPWRFVFLCTLPIVYFSLLHMLFVSSLRYRLPAEYPLCVLSAVGICQLLSICCGKRTDCRSEIAESS